ncbi:peptidase S9, prolyl oligopeptidase, partial [Rhodotorula diobovata]
SDSSILFSSFDGPAFRVERGEDGSWGEPKQVTPASSVLRFADFAPHSSQKGVTLAVVEDHTEDKPSTVVNTLGVISSDSNGPTLHTVASGADFYASPRWSPSGQFLTWVQWNHPDMRHRTHHRPWEGSELWVAKVARDSSGSLNLSQLVEPGSAVKVAGALRNVESVSQPRWALPSEDGTAPDKLVFLSDRTGFYELYVFEPEGDKEVKLLLKEPTGADVGGPDWVLGQSTHGPLSPTHWVSIASGGALRVISLADGTSHTVATPYVSIPTLCVVSPTQVAVQGSPATKPSLISLLDLPTSRSGDPSKEAAKEEILKVSSSASVDPAFISEGHKISYPTPDGATAYAILYPPASGSHEGPAGEAPPLVTRCHGGPTSAARRGLDWMVAFFTSRGFAFADVDYGGSSAGYGKDFRERLAGQWGVVDVNDTIACVEHLVKEGKVDKEKVAITGGSAGGFTVLAALTDSKVFTAGCSSYGISDLALLADDTHKFESNYLFKLLGGTPSEVPQNYHAAQITAPLLLLQGSEDRVVPPAQAQVMLDRVRGNGGVAEMIIFEGEGHGFRQKENRKRAMETELDWYRKTWGIQEEA